MTDSISHNKFCCCCFTTGKCVYVCVGMCRIKCLPCSIQNELKDLLGFSFRISVVKLYLSYTFFQTVYRTFSRFIILNNVNIIISLSYFLLNVQDSCSFFLLLLQMMTTEKDWCRLIYFMFYRNKCVEWEEIKIKEELNVDW